MTTKAVPFLDERPGFGLEEHRGRGAERVRIVTSRGGVNPPPRACYFSVHAAREAVSAEPTTVRTRSNIRESTNGGAMIARSSFARNGGPAAKEILRAEPARNKAG